ncbi:MAG TPA: NAD(P)-dependent oxidoreductase [Xanthobacteraceae bacterium]|nr:NAD(P)-dependent oxidoreductase [Xanthobacteraceae bacterium]
MKIGFIGLGQMGAGMAANLIKAGHDVTVYNRTKSRTEPLVKVGAKAAAHVAEASKADFVFTMLSDDRALEDVAFSENGLLANLPKDGTHISSSTISTALSARLTKAHRDASQRFISAPVFGRPDAAAAAKLFVIAAGGKAALDEAAPLFDAVGQKTFIVSSEPEAANLVKLSGNFLIASVIETLGEAMALVAKGGIERDKYLEILTSTLFNAPIYKTYGGLIAQENFSPPGFAAPLGQKDIRLALAAAEDLCVPMPVASLLRDRFLALMANGGEKLDWSAVAGLAAKDAGLSKR